MPEITFQDVSLRGRGRPRLEGLSFALGSGVTAVMGASGAGKTSLLNLLVGFERADGGEIQAPDSVAWVPSGLGLWPSYTVSEHLEK